MGTVTVYYEGGSYGSIQAINWLQENKLTVQLKRIDTITHREIFQLIYLTGLDIPDIIKDNKVYCIRYVKQKRILNKLRFSESLSFLERHSELLQTPIILSDGYALLGYDQEGLKNFLL